MVEGVLSGALVQQEVDSDKLEARALAGLVGGRLYPITEGNVRPYAGARFGFAGA